MTPLPLIQQLKWIDLQISHMQKHFPNKIAAGTLTADYAAEKLACALSIQNTLRMIRSLHKGEVFDV